jgi:4-hydroxy-tetrahydrodipicolinate reductase
MTRMAIAGATGRMGGELIRASTALADLQLTAAFDVVGAGKVGLDAGVVAGTPKPIGIAVTDRLEAGLENADVLIDFTRPAGTLRHLEA